MDHSMLGLLVHHQLLEFTQIYVHRVGDAIQPSHPLSSPSPPPSIFPSIWVFSHESVLFIRWPEYWSFSFNISPSNEHSGLISFRMDWLDLLAVQGTLKSLLQHHSSKASILQCSNFFIVIRNIKDQDSKIQTHLLPLHWSSPPSLHTHHTENLISRLDHTRFCLSVNNVPCFRPGSGGHSSSEVDQPSSVFQQHRY